MVFLEMLVLILFGVLAFTAVRYFQLKSGFDRKIDEWMKNEEAKIRKDAIERSARTLSGKTLEKLVPFLDKFPFDAHDMRWLGDPIDFVIFDGYSSKKSPEQIIFCEVKSGKSGLSKHQNEIKNLVEKGKVKWFEFRI